MATAEDEIRALRAGLAGLRAQVQGLEHQQQEERRLIPPGRISRGSLLRGAGALALGAAAGAVAAGAPDAVLATNGLPLLMGQDNTATSFTSISGSVLTDAALRVNNYYSGPFDDYSDALQAYTYGDGLSALYGRNDSAGGSGVFGYSGSGVGGMFSGAKAPLRLLPAASAGPPTSFNHQQGELYLDANGVLWLCTQSGTSSTVGTFQQVSGALQNPMTAQDDLIIGGASGAPARLGKGANGTYLGVDPTAGHLVWSVPNSGGGSGGTLDLCEVVSASNQNVGSGVAVTFTSAVWDPNSLWSSGSPTLITIKTPGKYRVRASAYVAGGTGYVDLVLNQNGAPVDQRRIAPSPDGNTICEISTELSCAANDTITFNIDDQNNTGTITTGTAYLRPRLSVQRIDGYAINPMIAQGDTIYGGQSGVPTRLAAGAQGMALQMGPTVPQWQWMQARTKAGAPTDGDFTSPSDGLLVVDTSNNKLWARTGGSWKGTALT